MSLLDDLLRLMGTNRTRMRWRLQQLRDKATRQKRSVANRSQALSYEHQLCPSCGHPEAKGDKVCSRCGARLHGVAVNRARKVASAFLPEGVPVVTMIYIAACVALYFVGVKATHDYAYATGGDAGGASPGSFESIRFGANFRELVAEGEYWRLITANFLHASVSHIAMNAFGIWISGNVIEERFGGARSAVVLIVTGAAGAFASYKWGSGFAVGASTAAFGQMGFVVGHALRFRGRGTADLRERFVTWLILGVIFTLADKHIDMWGHFGGLAAGLVLGVLVMDKQHARKLPAWVWNGFAIACLGAVAWAFYMAAAWQAPEWLLQAFRR